METNNIYLGNAYELIKEVPDKSVDLIITDPPYDIEGIHGSGLLKNDTRRKTYEETIGKFVNGIDLSILDEFARVMKKINIYIWCNKEQIIDYLDYFVKGKGCNWEMLIWAKTDPIPFCGTHYLKDKEYCLYFWEQGASVYIPYERGKTVYITKRNVFDKDNFLHPTIKDLGIIETLITNSSKEGDVILDPFLGSGTIALGCKHLKRNYIGFEIDKQYYDIATKRLQGENAKGELNLFDIDYDL